MSSQLPDFLAIKGKFHAPKDNYYGIFFILINTSTEYLDTASVVVTLSQEVNKIPIKESWHKFDQKINKVKYEGQYSQSITLGFQEVLNQLAEDNNSFQKIYSEIKNNNFSGLTTSFNILFNKVLHQEKLSIEIAIEQLSKEDLKTQPEESTSSTVQNNNDTPQDSVEGVFIDSSLIIDPTRGKKIGDIRSGETIMIKINPSSDRSNYFIDLLQLRTKDNKILPKEVLLTKKIELPKGMELIVKIDEGVFSKIFIESNNLLVKIPEEKTSSHSNQNPNQKNENKRNNQSSDKSSLKIIIIGAVIFLMIVVSAIFILSE